MLASTGEVLPLGSFGRQPLVFLIHALFTYGIDRTTTDQVMRSLLYYSATPCRDVEGMFGDTGYVAGVARTRLTELHPWSFVSGL